MKGQTGRCKRPPASRKRDQLAEYVNCRTGRPRSGPDGLHI
jgi:hypothetical protein